MKIKVISLFEKNVDSNGIYVNTTSKSEEDWQRDLSPFYLGPCKLYWDLVSQRMENAWQFSKVYPEYDNKGEPKESYFDWANKGWNNPNPVRYPMGKGRKPLYSYWDGNTYTYVEARKRIYIPLYAEAVMKTNGYRKLIDMTNDYPDKTLYLRDYDAYRHEERGMTLTDVVNCSEKKCGHAFVLMMLLTNDPSLRLCGM